MKRLRRCQLSVPGSSEKMLAKARTIAVDQIFLDLEDAVAPKAKGAARRNVIAAVREGGFETTTIAVRINDLSSPWALDDLDGWFARPCLHHEDHTPVTALAGVLR